MSRECLVVSPYFPPSSLAGVHRARHLAKHLPAAGWRPTIVCIDEAYHEERLDPALARLVPSTTEIIKAAAISPRLTRPIGLGELSLRGLVPLRRAIFSLLSSRDIRAVLVTGSPYYPMLLAGEIRRRFNVPVVLDFQDPWVWEPGHDHRRLSKAGLSHSLAVALEPRALASANFVTTVSRPQLDALAQRYRWLDKSRMAAIPIGGDADDFSALDTHEIDACGLDPRHFNVAYIGTIWSAVLPVLREFLMAVGELRQTTPALYERLRLHFVGTTANPNNHTDMRVLPLAEALGVADVVREIPRRLPYLDALAILSRSDAGLMIGSPEPHYTASKVYPYLMSGRPYLSLFHRASDGHAVVLAAGGGVALSFADEAELRHLTPAIGDGLQRLAHAASLPPLDRSAYAHVEASAIARRYGEIFDRLDVARRALEAQCA